MTKRSPRPDEPTGFLVPCPICHVAKNKVCMVRERKHPITGVMIPAHPADQMHALRIAMGQKWAYWHKGI